MAAKEANVPIIAGVSEGERDFIGVKASRAIVTAIGEELNVPIFLNADHTKSYERAVEAIDARFDSMVMDASALAFDQNVALVKRVIAYAKEKGSDIVIEGELGFIGTSSEVLAELPPGVPIEESKMTSPEEAKKFVHETHVDMLAPAVGNVHGIISSIGNPALSLKRVLEIKNAGGVPLTLHGASGVSESDVRGAVENGAAVVHFSTDLRVAYRKALTATLAEFPDEVAPYKYMRGAIKSLREITKVRISWLM